jgi:hypothetical protein
LPPSRRCLNRAEYYGIYCSECKDSCLCSCHECREIICTKREDHLRLRTCGCQACSAERGLVLPPSEELQPLITSSEEEQESTEQDEDDEYTPEEIALLPRRCTCRNQYHPSHQMDYVLGVCEQLSKIRSFALHVIRMIATVLVLAVAQIDVGSIIFPKDKRVGVPLVSLSKKVILQKTLLLPTNVGALIITVTVGDA